MRNTGKPHIDKPWEKYYSTKKIDSVDIDMNMVDYLRMKHKDNLDIVVETYYGREFTLREILKDSDNAARVLSFLGVKKGEVIANLLPNSILITMIIIIHSIIVFVYSTNIHI